MVEEVPPSGAGVKTVTCAVPAVATSLAGMFAVSCVALIKLVGRGEPFQRTTESAIKLLPLTVSLKGESPLLALAGEMEVRPGSGLLAPDPYTCSSPTEMKYAEPPGVPSMRRASPVMGVNVRV